MEQKLLNVDQKILFMQSVLCDPSITNRLNTYKWYLREFLFSVHLFYVGCDPMDKLNMRKYNVTSKFCHI